MLLQEAISDKNSFRRHADLEINCPNCARNILNNGNCGGYLKDCILYSPNTNIDLSRFWVNKEANNACK